MRQNLSANTLFHFTNNINNIDNILKNGFYPHYCPEDATALGLIAKKSETPFICTPMVCFCDILLSQIKDHTDKYGKYAIGLSKEWGIANNINPLMYVLPKITLSKVFIGVMQKYYEHLNENKKIGPIGDILYYWLYLSSFIKPYVGYLWRGKQKQSHKIRFYDEREWRYVPDINVLIANNLPQFSGVNTKLHALNKRLEALPLQFESKYIKYIIVNKETEILKMKNKLRAPIGLKHKKTNVKRIETKIISMEQILEDF